MTPSAPRGTTTHRTTPTSRAPKNRRLTTVPAICTSRKTLVSTVLHFPSAGRIRQENRNLFLPATRLSVIRLQVRGLFFGTSGGACVSALVRHQRRLKGSAFVI